MEQKKAMISQPMSDVSRYQIIEDRARATTYLERKGYHVISHMKPSDMNILHDYLEKEKLIRNPQIYNLSADMIALAMADILYMVRGWEKSRGCRMERMVARIYGLEILYEKEMEDKQNANK